MTSPNLVQETNIERILEDHLWKEIDAIRARITDLKQEIEVLALREKKLIDIANAADIGPPLQ